MGIAIIIVFTAMETRRKKKKTITTAKAVRHFGENRPQKEK